MPSKYTIILPLHNGGSYLPLCVESILSQTWQDFDLAVLENCSTDGSAEWLAGIQDDRLKVYPSNNLLSSLDNWERGLHIPHGSYVGFIGHDDLMSPDHLEVMDELIRRHPEAGLCHARFSLIDANGSPLGLMRPFPEVQSGHEYVATLLTVPGREFIGCMMRSELYRKVGSFPRYGNGLCTDYALLLLLAWNSPLVATAEKETFQYRRHSASYSGSASLTDFLEGVNAYFDFLTDLLEQDEQFCEAFQPHVLHHCLNMSRNVYKRGLSEASLQNEQIDGSILARLQDALGKVSPELVPAIRNRKLRRYERINKSALLRAGYRLYRSSLLKKVQSGIIARGRLRKRPLVLPTPESVR